MPYCVERLDENSFVGKTKYVLYVAIVNGGKWL